MKRIFESQYGGKYSWEWTEEKIAYVIQAIDDFIEVFEITDPQLLLQSDNGYIESPILVGKILEILNVDFEEEGDDD